MDSGNESEPSSIELRKYAKPARMGRLIKSDGSVHNVPNWDEEPERLDAVVGEIARIEKILGTGRHTSLLRSGFEMIHGM